MLRKISIIALAAAALTAQARDPETGYRGFVDWDNSIGAISNFQSATGKVKRDTNWFIGVSTTHGYQLNENVFVGGGILFSASAPGGNLTLPLYAAARYDCQFSQFTPFGDIRLGYNMADGGGIYFSPTVGYRLSLGSKTNINFGLGLTVRGYTEDITFIISDDHFISEGVEKNHKANAMFTFRIGFDF